MRIYIPSRSRADNIRTWEDIKNTEWRERTTIVVPHFQFDEYVEKNPYAPIMARPETAKTIGQTRQWICESLSKEHGDRQVFMMDDDLRIMQRYENDWRLKGCNELEVDAFFKEISLWIQEFPMVGVSLRQGNNFTFPRKRIYNGRMTNAYCVDAEILEKEGVKWDRVPVMEDFDVTLQMLKKGYQNVIIQEYVVGQPVSNMEGGCSDYRTAEVQEEAANMLAALHPECVQVTEKRTASWGGGLGVRADVRIQWKVAISISGADLIRYPEM